jgi:hypothetical protein
MTLVYESAVDKNYYKEDNPKPHDLDMSFGYYIGDIQAFLAYSYLHPELTEQDWKDLGWVEDYEQWWDDISYVDLEGLVNGLATEAIKVAIEFDCFSGGKVKSYSFTKPKATKKVKKADKSVFDDWGAESSAEETKDE